MLGDRLHLALGHARRNKDKLAVMLYEPVVIADRRFSVGASIGIAIFPADADDAEDLLKMADKAMYRAKQAGHNSYLFCAAENSSD